MLSCLGTAFLTHFNAPAFYSDMAAKDAKEKTDKFVQVTAMGYASSTLVFAAMMFFGFGTFGSATSGNIFVNYAPSDSLAFLCRIATV